MKLVYTTLILLLVVSGGCSHARGGGSSPGAGEANAGEAKVQLSTVQGVSLKGHATLEEVKDGVLIKLKVSDDVPGMRGVHIHEIGDCSDIAGKSMGEHFAPDAAEHGLPSEPSHHFGDLGNIVIEDSGQGELEIIVARASLSASDTHSLLGRAVVMHEGRDTGEGPSGESGAPIACAVIERK